MLRFLSTICDLLSAVCAILSPVAICHWLLKSINAPGTASVVEALNPVFNPLNELIDAMVHVPPLRYEHQEIATTQAVLACILTVGFFALNFASESMKASKQRLEIRKQADTQRKRLHKLREAEQKAKQQALTNRRIFLQVGYEFAICPEGASQLEKTFTQFGARLLERQNHFLTLEFQNIKQALDYCIASGTSVLQYYSTLRPIEPQPPFRMGVYALEANDDLKQALRLIDFAGNNQAVFTQDVKAMLDAEATALPYQYQSLGMYAVPGGYQQELYRLTLAKNKPA